MPTTPDLSRRPRSSIAFTDADMVRLRDLYYDLSLSIPKVAQAFGVHASTLTHWIAEMDWPRRSKLRPPPAPCDPVAPEAPTGQTAPSAPPLPDPPGKREQNRKLARRLGEAARAELDGLGDPLAPMSLAERERRARIISSLSRSIARMDAIAGRGAEIRRLKNRVARGVSNAAVVELERANTALLTSMLRDNGARAKPAQRPAEKRANPWLWEK